MGLKKVSGKERRALGERSKEEREKIFGELCKHLEMGLSLECFGLLSDTSIRNWCKKYPEEFIEEELQDAMRKGREGWEMIGRKQSTGECLGNSRSWFYNMANRYGWREKIDLEAEHKGSVNVNVVSYASTKARTDAQENE